MTPSVATNAAHRWLERLPVKPHPALLQLQARLFRSQVSKLLRGLRSPRRIVLSAIAVVLAFVWTAQTILAILFRQPADPQLLRQWIGLGMYAYAAWHFVKAAFRPTEHPLEWTAAEIHWLHASPLSRADLLGHRLASILTAAALKASCFCIVMIPDIHQPALAGAAMLAGLIVIDLLRLMFDLFAWGLSPQGRWWMRATAITFVVAAVGQAITGLLGGQDLSVGWLQLGRATLEQLQAAQLSTPWRLFVQPFLSVADIALARSWTPAALWSLASLAGATLALTLGIGALDRCSRQAQAAA